MLSLVILSAMLGQTAPGGSNLQKYILRCQEGHEISINGYLDGGNVHAILGPPTVYRGPGTAGGPAPQGDAAPAQAAIVGGKGYANYGVMTGALDRLPPGKEWYGGNAPNPIGGPERTGKPMNRLHLTFIGSQAEREAARKDLESNPEYRRIAEQLGDLLAVQDYDPSNPLVKNIGLPDGGRPDIVIQTTAHPLPLYRAHDYPGARVLITELRKADPRYDPSKDPNGSGLPGGLDLSRFLQFPTTLTEWLIIAGVGGILLYLLKN